MSKVDFIHKQWRECIRLFKIFPFIFALIIGYNSWREYEAGLPFDWMNLIYFTGFLIFLGFLYVFMRLIFKFVLAKTLHSERRR
jgi:hypothetical protein